MTFSTEQLSAFLDGELPPAEMEMIRAALVEDETLADRLAELAAVDATLAETYGAIDARPLPEAVSRLLYPQRSAGKVTSMPLRTRINRTVRNHAVMAASVTLAAAVALGALLNTSPEQTPWRAVAIALENTPSGTTRELENGATITPSLTFMDTRGDYCRLFAATGNGESGENLACRRDGAWQLDATLPQQGGDDGIYRPVSGGSPLQTLVNDLLAEGPYDRERENALIEKDWQNRR